MFDQNHDTDKREQRNCVEVNEKRKISLVWLRTQAQKDDTRVDSQHNIRAIKMYGNYYNDCWCEGDDHQRYIQALLQMFSEKCKCVALATYEVG